METIRNYLDNMFATLPKTKALARLREELLANMMDKYTELKSQGKSENEAVGIVIAEFGNIQELASELDIELPEGDARQKVELETAKQFVGAKKRNSRLVGLGVLLCIAGPTFLIQFSNYMEQAGNSRVLPVVVMLGFVACAVGLLIYAGFRMEPYKYMEEEVLLTPSAEQYVRSLREQVQNKRVMGTIIGVIMCILAPALLLLLNTTAMDTTDSLRRQFPVVAMLLMVAAAVYVLVVSSSESSACDRLLKRGEYSETSRQEGRVHGAVASVWWPLTVLIFFGLGFFAPSGFGTAWMVWPVSGILFGAVASAISILQKKK